jgi:uncharacterized protein YprB with RNaseH-like and TPR domain
MRKKYYTYAKKKICKQKKIFAKSICSKNNMAKSFQIDEAAYIDLETTGSILLLHIILLLLHFTCSQNFRANILYK